MASYKVFTPSDTIKGNLASSNAESLQLNKERNNIVGSLNLPTLVTTFYNSPCDFYYFIHSIVFTIVNFEVTGATTGSGLLRIGTQDVVYLGTERVAGARNEVVIPYDQIIPPNTPFQLENGGFDTAIKVFVIGHLIPKRDYETYLNKYGNISL